eukprot:UC4_evm3s647
MELVSRDDRWPNFHKYVEFRTHTVHASWTVFSNATPEDLNLDVLCQRARNTVWNERRFPAAIMRILKPVRATANIFKSGKVVVTGAKNPDQCEYAAKKITKSIQKAMGGLGDTFSKKIKFRNFKVNNIAGVCKYGHYINLAELLAECSTSFGTATFEPEIFPGLIFKHQSPRITITIFHNGSITLTGARKIEDMKIGLSSIEPLLDKVRLANPNSGPNKNVSLEGSSPSSLQNKHNNSKEECEKQKTDEKSIDSETKPKEQSPTISNSGLVQFPYE